MKASQTRFGFTYGWCAYCPNFTYHDLVHSSCADCRDRWRRYPQTLPDEWRRNGWAA